MYLFKAFQKLSERFLVSSSFFVLFTIYPILGLYAGNAIGVAPYDVIRPLFISLTISVTLYHVFRRLHYHRHSAALAVFILVFGFFFYEHFYDYFHAKIIIISSAVFAALWTLLFSSAFLWISVRRMFELQSGFIIGLNVMALALLFFPMLNLARYIDSKILPFNHKSNVVTLGTETNAPDIYYIILDSYAREDTLRDELNYDNSEFISSLDELGFFVAECSQSNYSSTSLSLASSLNLDYLQNLSDVFNPQQVDLLPNLKLLETNAVRRMLTDAGYRTVTFSSGFYWIEWRNADEFLSPHQQGPTAFETLILYSTYARLLDEFGIIDFSSSADERYRARTHLVVDSFDDLLNIPGPKFVFIHVVSPHPPFVFAADGSPIASRKADPVTGYLSQLKYISRAILPGLTKLVNESSRPPVIILQSDHGIAGYGSSSQMKILNAYYMPGHTNQLYHSISPVNSFRVVFNSYFGTTYPLLDDISYYSDPSEIYKFTEVAQTCP